MSKQHSTIYIPAIAGREGSEVVAHPDRRISPLFVTAGGVVQLIRARSLMYQSGLEEQGAAMSCYAGAAQRVNDGHVVTSLYLELIEYARNPRTLKAIETGIQKPSRRK